eukprot:CAMPEP_0116053328 /NCGR_PEP_ID=MMETSP0322-20121206/2115_1 /TAXON_ID=163516 /ORGANISM="Leptocylindrus danicus var. apora, Strain B651" /LENGTH=794 /DNA_ID=CAMNT_0003536457 /DNA_START=7 /DNA_END=2391 /DNA_ORIENTATION=+
MTNATTDLSIRIGGRVVSPALPIVDGSFPDSEDDARFTKCLRAFSEEHIKLETLKERQRRERVLNAMAKMCRSWIEGVCREKLGLTDIDAIRSAAGNNVMHTSGSYRLDVQEPGADIDTICVAPSIVTREHFFGTVVDPITGRVSKDPLSLAERIRAHPDVTNFNAVESAAVPILTFDWEGVNIDLLFARLATSTVPPEFDINDDRVLDGVDSATEKSLNGPRVTNLIAKFMSGTPERYQNFLFVVRCVRKWAKTRGLYSNKMGYWGGVNINIAVAMVVQLYPNASPGNLLRKFFLVFKSWRWPNPVLLCKPHDAGLGLQVWSAFTNARDARQVAPIITPAYPAMNSTLSVSRQTLQIFHQEFTRAYDIISRIWQETVNSKSDTFNSNGEMFAELFRPSDFFISYPHYLSLCIVGSSQDEVQSWAGYVESRLRKLVSDVLGKLPISNLQLWPKKIEACIAERDSNLTLAQRKNCMTYFIGFKVDVLRMRGNELNIEQSIYSFKESDLKRFQPHFPGQDIVIGCHHVKSLPRMVFAEYDGGKEGAMKIRRRIMIMDPKRMEARSLRNLKEQESEVERKKASLLEKIAQLKSAQANSEESEIVEPNIDENNVGDDEKMIEDIPSSTNIIDENEADLLESALDAIQDADIAGTKTRQQAAKDRMMLMTGLNEDTSNEILRKAGIDIIEDNSKLVTLGGSHASRRRRAGIIIEEGERRNIKRVRHNKGIVFNLTTKFEGLIELDVNGLVVDKGDENFAPSKTWNGRKGGFEFKLGLRGLGYYRTGCKVIVPSNTAYET